MQSIGVFHGVSDGSLNRGWRVCYPCDTAYPVRHPLTFALQKMMGSPRLTLKRKSDRLTVVTFSYGVSDGSRTHGLQGHNLTL